MTLNELREQAESLRSELVSLYDAAVERGQDASDETEVRGAFTEVDGVQVADPHAGLTDSEAERAEALKAQIAENDVWIERYAPLEDVRSGVVHSGGTNYKAAESVQFSSNRTASPWDFDSARAADSDELRGQVMTAIEQIPRVTDEVRSGLTDMVDTLNDPSISRHVLATASPEYRSAFRKFLVSDGTGAMFTEAERSAYEFAQEQRTALALGSGWQLPVTIDPTTRFTSAQTASPIRGLASQRTITTKTHHSGTMSNATFGMALEGAEVTDGSPTVADVSIDAEKAHGVLLWSFEAENDVEALEADLRTSAARGVNNLEATQFLSGTGTSPQVEGLLDGTTITRVSTDAATVIDADDLIDFLNAIPDEYVMSSTFMASQQTLNSFRLLESSGGANLWTSLPGSAIEGARPTGLLGIPTRIHSGMNKPTGSALFTTATDYMILGDFEAGYRIVDRVGMTVEPMRLVLGGTANLPTGQRGMYMTWRFGGGILNANALRVLDTA